MRLQWRQLTTGGQCVLHAFCLGQAAVCVDASVCVCVCVCVCGLERLSQALYLYSMKVCVFAESVCER